MAVHFTMPVTVPRFIYRLIFRTVMRLPSSASLLTLGCFAVAAVACSKDEEPKKSNVTAAQLSEPVGAEVPAKGSVPAISLALAVAKGQDPVTFLPTIVGAVSQAVSACPAFVSEEKDVTAVNFTLENGKMKVPARADSPGIKCLAAALDGKDAGPAGTNLSAARVEIKVPAAGPKTP